MFVIAENGSFLHGCESLLSNPAFNVIDFSLEPGGLENQILSILGFEEEHGGIERRLSALYTMLTLTEDEILETLEDGPRESVSIPERSTILTASFPLTRVRDENFQENDIQIYRFDPGESVFPPEVNILDSPTIVHVVGTKCNQFKLASQSQKKVMECKGYVDQQRRAKFRDISRLLVAFYYSIEGIQALSPIYIFPLHNFINHLKQAIQLEKVF